MEISKEKIREIKEYFNNKNDDRGRMVKTPDGTKFLFVSEDDIDNFCDRFPEYCDMADYVFDYFMCAGCGKFFPAYSYTNYGVTTDEGFFCEKSLDKEKRLKQIINKPNKAAEFLSDEFLKENGFTELPETYASGLYDHQNDHPEEIFKILRDKYSQVVLKLHSSDVFSVQYRACVR